MLSWTSASHVRFRGIKFCQLCEDGSISGQAEDGVATQF